MKDNHLAVNWAKSVISPTANLIVKTIVDTDYSFVAEIKHNQNIYFLKKNHKKITKEQDLISYLYNQDLNDLKIIDKNNDLNCFIMDSAGKSITSDNLFYHCFEIAEKLINIQIKSNSLILEKKFLKNDIVNLCDKYQITKDNILLSWDFIEKSLPMSIEHGDIHLGNILLSDNNQSINFIDFAESTFTNPMFSLLSFEAALKGPGRQDAETVLEVRDHWLKIYSAETSIDKSVLKEAYNHSKTVYPLYCISSMDYLLKIEPETGIKNDINSKILKYKDIINNNNNNKKYKL